jgi:hypothetical protein
VRPADQVNDNVNGGLAQLIDKVTRPINCLCGSDLLNVVGMGVGRPGDNRRSAHCCKLHSGRADPARGAGDENPLCTYLRALKQTFCCGVRTWKRGEFRVSEGTVDNEGLTAPDAQILCECAINFGTKGDGDQIAINIYGLLHRAHQYSFANARWINCATNSRDLPAAIGALDTREFHGVPGPRRISFATTL